MADKKSFVFYHKWKELLEDLSADDIRDVVFALIEYSESNTIPTTLSPIANQTFKAFRQLIDEDTQKWENTCKRNAENGKNGGRPQKPKKPTGLFGLSEKPKKADNDNEHDNDNEYDNELTPPTPSKGKTASKKRASKPKIEKTQFAEFVSMTNDEYTSLVAKVGEQGAKRCIEILDNYKGASGKTYESDYRAILNWVIARCNEEQQKAAKIPVQAAITPYEFDPNDPYKDWR